MCWWLARLCLVVLSSEALALQVAQALLVFAAHALLLPRQQRPANAHSCMTLAF